MKNIAMSRLDALIGENFQLVAFKDLPLPYQLAVVNFMAVDGDAWQFVPGVCDSPSSEDIAAAMVCAMPQYELKYGAQMFGMLVLPVAVIQQAVMADDEIGSEFPDWNSYHQWYASSGLPSHPATDRWPVLLSNDDYETLRDGWHRLHSYIKAGHPDIPAVFFPETRHTITAPQAG